MFHSEYDFALDWDNLYELAGKKGRFICSEKPLIAYRVHAAATTKACIEDNRRPVDEMAMFRKMWPDWMVKILMHFTEKPIRSTKMRKADVIIPTFKPGDKLEKLLRRLLEQSVPVGRVIIMNTEEKYWDAERFESLFEGEDTKLTVCHIRQSEFDHGRTRHEGILKSDADVCICMTHDCVPYDRNLVKELLEALDASERVAAA